MLGGRNYRIDIADLGQDDPGTATKALHARARANQPYSVTKRNLTRELGGDPDYADEILQTYRYVAPAPRHPRRKRNDVDDCIRRLQTEGFDVTYYGPEGKEEEKPAEPDDLPPALGQEYEPPEDVHEGRPPPPGKPRRSKRLKSRARQRYPSVNVPGTHRGSNEPFQRLQTGRRSFGSGFLKRRGGAISDYLPSLNTALSLAGLAAKPLAAYFGTKWTYDSLNPPGVAVPPDLAKAQRRAALMTAATSGLAALSPAFDSIFKENEAAQSRRKQDRELDLEERRHKQDLEIMSRQEDREDRLAAADAARAAEEVRQSKELFDIQKGYANTVANFGPANLLPAWNRYTSDSWISRGYRRPSRRVQYYHPYASQAPVYSGRRRRRRAFDGYLERAPPRRRRSYARRRGGPRFGNPRF